MNPYTSSQTHGMKAIMVGKARWKPLELLLPKKIVNQNSITSLEGLQTGVTSKNSKDAGVLVPITSPFNSSVWPVQKIYGSWNNDD